MPRRYKHCALLVLTFASLSCVLAKPDEIGAARTLHYAKNFRITDFPNHRIATVYKDGSDLTIARHYALVPRNVPLPELPENIPVIRTPVKNVVALETIYIGFLDALNQLDTIIGAGTTDYVSNSTVRQGIEGGAIQKVQTVGALNTERLLLMKPDLILTSVPSEPALKIPTQLVRAGLPVVVTAEYRERHPLARAEWIKFIAAFFDATEAADKTFNAIANRYEALLQKVDAIKERPTVFCGAPYSGVWHMAGGDSYMAQFIQDAGGNYLWNDVIGADAIPLDFERVFLKAADADIWLNPGIHQSRQMLFAADRRFKKFRASKTGHIYNNTRQRTADTGNPIWETGIVNPDRVLADLIKIFHPNRMADREFFYHEQLE